MHGLSRTLRWLLLVTVVALAGPGPAFAGPATLPNNGYHVAVMLEGRVDYDAYTGPLGMKLADYLGRLHAPAGVGWNVVTTP